MGFSDDVAARQAFRLARDVKAELCCSSIPLLMVASPGPASGYTAVHRP
jgi:hypothetical protein